MATAESLLTMVMAGGVGERLQPLTRDRAKAAVPFGGKFRIIDFTLSNCVNSGLRKIYILTQYRSGSLNQHIQEGWGISSSGLGDFIYCVPAQQRIGADWYRGTADAVRQNIHLINDKSADNVLVLAGDHIYKMDYQLMLNFHKQHDADVTVSAIRVPKSQAAGKLGVLETDTKDRLVGFEEKPPNPRGMHAHPDMVLASMGIYMFRSSTLKKVLEGNGDDFGKNIIPSMVGKDFKVFVFDYERENRIEDYIDVVRDGRRTRTLIPRVRDSAYWKDVGTIDSYYDANMDLVGVDPIFNLYGGKWPIRTLQRPLPPSKCVIGGRTPESIISDGCIISGGTVWNSILSPGVIVERDASVEQSIIFDDVTIEPAARVRRAIIDKETVIEAGVSVGYDHDADRRRGCLVSDNGIVVIPKGVRIR